MKRGVAIVTKLGVKQAIHISLAIHTEKFVRKKVVYIFQKLEPSPEAKNLHYYSIVVMQFLLEYDNKRIFRTALLHTYQTHWFRCYCNFFVVSNNSNA